MCTVTNLRMWGTSVCSLPFIYIASSDAYGTLTSSRHCHIQVHVCVRRVGEKAGTSQDARSLQLLEGFCTQHNAIINLNGNGTFGEYTN